MVSSENSIESKELFINTFLCKSMPENRNLNTWLIKSAGHKSLMTIMYILLFAGSIFSLSIPATAQHYDSINLTSDVPGLAQITDPNLVNSWGIAHPPTGPWWVADNGMGVSTLYNTGCPYPPGCDPLTLIVTIPPPTGGSGPSAPTGIVFNGGSDFNVTPGNPARFIFVTEDGTISAWNPTVDPVNAKLKVNNSPGAVYKGVTIARNGGTDFLYVANFRGGTVDVLDTNFNPVTLGSGAFMDTKIPAGFAPFNVQNIQGNIFVAFAKQDALKHDNLDGLGLGFVDVFDPGGNLLMRLEHGNWMNAPWGIALAPSDFGEFSNDLLVGNFGSGQIAAFEPKNGNFKDLLRGDRGKPISIDGLWGLGFGNGANAGPVNTLFFAAGINHESDGLFGIITSVSPAAPVATLTPLGIAALAGLLGLIAVATIRRRL
jgi:uncharacterized protein (TIGR03118 family)